MFMKKAGAIAPRAFNSFLRHTLGRVLLRAYNVEGENVNLLKEISPPYLILPNHVMFWDPFLVGAFIDYPVHYVTSDMQFRSPVLRFLLNLVGAIPKSKFISDTETIKRIVRIKAHNGIIGVFPEGRRTWDGHTLPLFYSTAKLVKALKVPVVVPILKGGYLSWPRWSRYSRKGKMIISFRLGFTKERLSELSVDDIHNELTRLLQFNEYDFQRSAMLAYTCAKRAEGLERALFICPRCCAMDTLISKKHQFSCTECGYSVVYNINGFFELPAGDNPQHNPHNPLNDNSDSQKLYFDNIRNWNLWQLDYFSDYLKGASSSEVPLASEHSVTIYHGFRANPLKQLCKGRMVLFNNRLEIVLSDNGESGAKSGKRERLIENGFAVQNNRLLFPLTEIEGANVQNREKFEFYYKRRLYHFEFANKNTSSYKWLNSVHILQGKAPNY